MSSASSPEEKSAGGRGRDISNILSLKLMHPEFPRVLLYANLSSLSFFFFTKSMSELRSHLGPSPVKNIYVCVCVFHSKHMKNQWDYSHAYSYACVYIFAGSGVSGIKSALRYTHTALEKSLYAGPCKFLLLIKRDSPRAE